MDFASLLSAQLGKSKQPPTASGPKKYLKRSELEAQRLEEYEAEQKRAEDEARSRQEKKRRLEEDEAEKAKAREDKRRKLAEESKKIREEEEREEERLRRKRLGLPELPEIKQIGSAEGTPVPEDEDVLDEELCMKLRALEQPAKLFGESHVGRLKRYKRIVDKSLAPVMSNGPIPTILELVPEAEMKVPDSIPTDLEACKYLHRQLASYFTMVLSEWQVALAGRDQAVKTSTSGKAAYSAMLQARDNMVPLFRKLEKGEIEKSILGPVVEIVRCCQRRRYVDANDAYLRLSIGKAAWPIGVTMVGIHERSAREKLHESDNAAHIMSDEITRKFLQSIKRCLSFAQTRWPPDDQLQLMG
ncbi:hypothetical protein ANO11243_087990 [Dothideomycetidae sp. 11243]|nr:hypothetical protein ANO11243_087990 [fungal sp. No.11243]